MELLTLDVITHKKIAKDTFEIILSKPTDIELKAGQFAMIKVNEMFLKRPLSISSFTQTTVTFIYKILGKGTKKLSEEQLEKLEVMLPLGCSFPLAETNVTLIAGGVGIAPMHELAKQLSNNNCKLDIHLGYKTKDEIFLDKQLSEYGNVTIYTEDGSFGTKGYCLPKKIAENDLIYGCGPHGMLTAIANNYKNDGWLSTEEYMACGFGICAGCVIKLKSGMKKVCVDGPIFAKEEFKC